MLKAIGPALVVGGALLLYFGYQAQQAASSQVEEFFTGRPSDDALYMLVGGAVALVLGLGLSFKGFKKQS